MDLDKAKEAAKRVRLVVLDVDGVLTDGSIWTGEAGEAVKRFYARDGLGIKMLQAAGIPVAILTGRVSAQTAARAAELGICSVAQGKQFKTRRKTRGYAFPLNVRKFVDLDLNDKVPDGHETVLQSHGYGKQDEIF